MVDSGRGVTELTDFSIDSKSLHQALEELRLNETTFRYGIEEIERAQLVLAFLQTHRESPISVRRLSSFIAPTVCASREDQALFHDRFAELLTKRRAPALEPDTALNANEIRDSTTAPDELTPASRADRRVEWRYWGRLLVLGLLTVLVVVGTALLWTSDMKPGDVQSTPSLEANRTPPPRESYLSTLADRRHLLLGLSPLTVALLVVCWRRRRQANLRRRFSLRRFDETEVRLGDSHDAHLDRPLMARTLPAFRRTSSTGQMVFDPSKSVGAAAAAGGRAMPQFRETFRALEFLLLIRRDGAADHANRVARDLAKHLRSAGVSLAVYEVLGIAERLRPRADLSFGIVPLPGDQDDAVMLADALDAAPRAVVLFFGDGRGLEVGSDAPQDSAAGLLARCGARAILTPVPVSRWGAREQALEDAGYAVVPADSRGIAVLGEWVIDGNRPDVAPMTLKVLQRSRRAELSEYRRFPRLLVSAASRFLSRHEPPQDLIEKLLLQLKTYLGDAAFAWLSALAVYPRVAPDLTRELGRRLKFKPGRMLFSEQGYLALAQLPWVMRGSIPDWLREALISRLDASFAGEVKRELRNLLICPTAAGGVGLRIVGRSGAPWREVWDQLLKGLTPDAELHEHVFLDFALGGPRLSVAAPHALTRVILGLRRLLGVEVLLALACVTLSGMVLLRPTPNIDPVAGQLAEWGWLIALFLLPVWNAWRLTRVDDELTVEGVVFGILVTGAIAIDGSIVLAWSILVVAIICWLLRWLRRRPWGAAPVVLLAVIPVLLLGIITVIAVPPAKLDFIRVLRPPETLPWLTVGWLTHLAITLIGLIVAVRLALQAFARRSLSIADVPTFPRYLTSPQQYRLGSWMFAIFVCGFFLLLVYEHRQVVVVAAVFQKELPGVVGAWLDAAKDESPSYLLVTTGIGGIYLYLLTLEAPWNVLLMMRDTIQSWISIPELAREIVAKIQFSLHVPVHAISELAGGPAGVREQDFYKDRNAPDRQWAETCYMKWWLTLRQDAGEDAIFFADESFGFEKLLRDFDEISLAMRSWRSGANDPAIMQLAQGVKKLHKNFSRLVSCYLIYRNASREELCLEAREFGLDVAAPLPENPLRYWTVYAIALITSVYVGVYASAIAYDWFNGQGFNFDAYTDRALAWAAYSLANYGGAIVAILLLRTMMQSRRGQFQSYLMMYCWTFLVAFLAGPFGLAVTIYYFGPERYASLPLLQLFYEMLRWGLGPGLVAVYISYYLDRQTAQDLRDINQSGSTFGWRLLNCFGFAAVTVFLLLPPLLSLQVDQPDAGWDSAKLRFVATGTTFFIAFGVALTAQFALRKAPQAARPVLTPRVQ